MLSRRFILLCSILLLLLGLVSFSYAQDPPPSPDPTPAEEEAELQTPVLDVSSVCAEQVADFASKKKNELGEFLNTHFRSIQPTSELIPAAVEKFREYRSAVRDYAHGIIPQAGRLGAEAGAETNRCDEAIKDDFDRTKELIRNHVLQNASAKKSTRLVNKYKSINSKLEKLNFKVAQMYGYFGALSQKLPCYATQCVRR